VFKDCTNSVNVGSNAVFVTHNMNKVAESDVKGTDIPLPSNQSNHTLIFTLIINFIPENKI